MIQNDTYGEITHEELADLRLHAQRCIECGMLATVDPVFHAARYAHAPRINHGGGIIFRWDSQRHEWIQETRDAAKDARGAAFEETVSAAGEVLHAELTAAGTDKAARRAAWARYGDAQDAAGAAYRAAQAASPPKIGVPYAWTDPDTGAKTCPECGQIFPETYDADDKPVTFNYATHYQREHEESPR